MRRLELSTPRVLFVPELWGYLLEPRGGFDNAFEIIIAKQKLNTSTPGYRMP